MTVPLDFLKTPDEQALFWNQLRQDEAKRALYVQQANANVAQAVGDFHQRAPYADPGATLAIGTGIANGSVDPNQAAQAVDQSVQQGNRPEWTAAESTGSHITPKGNDPLVTDAKGNVDPAATLKAAGLSPDSTGGGFDWKNPGDYAGAVGSAAKGTLREGLSAASSGWEVVQNEGAQGLRTLGDAASALKEGDVVGAGGALVSHVANTGPDALAALSATNVAQQAAQYVKLGEIDLGSGFFPGGTVTKLWQPDVARDVRGTIGDTTITDPDGTQHVVRGPTVTFGRQIAAKFEQPGTKQFNIMSGLIDGASQFALDPSLALQDALMVPRAAKVFEFAGKAAEEAPAAGEALAGAKKVTPLVAAMNSAEGKSVILDLKNAKSPEAVAGIIGSDLGQPLLARIAKADDWPTIRRLLVEGSKSNSAWREEFAKIGGDAAAHVASTVTPEAVQEASKGILLPNGERPTTNAVDSAQWLDHPNQEPFLQVLADSSDPIEIAKRLGPQVPPSLISAVTKTSDLDAVKQALKNELGLSIATTADLPGLRYGYEMKRQILHAIPGFDALTDVVGREAARATARVPDQYFAGFLPNATGIEQRASLESMDDWAKTAKIDYATRSNIYGKVADGFASGSAEGRYQALNAWTDVMEQGAANLGVDPRAAKNMMNLWKDRFSTRYGVDNMARPADFDFVATQTGNADLTMTSPSLLSQELGSLVQMPDPREFRRLTSKFGRLISDVQTDPVNGIQQASNLKFGLSHIQALGEEIFPRLAIMRGATALRVMMDEQLRLYAAGLPTMLHPIQYLALTAGSSGDLSRLGIGTEDATKMLDEGAGSIARVAPADMILRRTRATGAWMDVGKGDQWLDGAADTARQFNRDPIASRVAQGLTTDEIVDYLHSPGGAKNFENYKLLGQNAKSTSAATGKIISTPVDLTDESVLRGWIDQNIRGQVDAFTNGNSDLRKAIGTNVLPNASGNVESGAIGAFDQGGATPGFQQMLRDWMDHPDSPQRVKYNMKVADLADPRTKMDQWDTFTNWAMGKLFNVPIRTLTRSPVFRQQFYERVAELAHQLHPDEANKLLKTIEATAGEQGFAGKVSEFLGGDKQLQAVIDGAKDAHGDLALDDVFNYAKGHALDTVKSTLYDTARKSNIEQSMRIIAPFGYAWRQIVTDWAKILGHNPGFLRSTQMTVQGARGSGFFYTDPVSGKEVFNYPMSDWAQNAITGGGAATAISAGVSQMVGGVAGHLPVVGPAIQSGIDTAAGAIPVAGAVMSAQGGLPGADPLRGDVQGLNLASAGIPGLNPVLQIPLAHLLKDKPQADFIRGLLMPYGVPTDENAPILGELGAYILPGWMQKIGSAIMTSPDSTSSYGNTYAQVLQQLASSGKYGTGLQDRQRMIEDAKSKAQVLTVLRGLGQFVAPSSPSYAPEIKTNQGDMLMSELAKAAHDLQAKDYNTWVQKFIDQYGEGPFIAAQAKTRAAQGGLDASSAFGSWEADHRAALSSYKDVAGYFADVGSDFDSEVYNRQVQSGQRVKLSGDELLNASQATLAKWQMNQARQMVGAHPTVAQLDWLSKVKTALEDKYPGYKIEPSVQVANLPTKINQLEEAVKDPSLKGDIQTATATYLYLRNQALDEAKARGSRGAGSLAGTAEADLRAWLAGKATEIIAKYPTFSRLFDGVLSAEVQ